MKNLFLAPIVVSLIMLASCGEAKLENDIVGQWRVNKYLVNGGDRTADFNSARPNMVWTFKSNKEFSKWWDYTWDSVSITVNYPNDTVWNIVPVHTSHGYEGTWLLTNSNKYIQTSDDSSGTVEYKILEHKSSSLHIYSNGEEYYLVAK